MVFIKEEDGAKSLSREPHVFRLSQTYKAGGGALIVIVSWDGSIVHMLDDDDYWNNQFPSGVNKLYVEGHWDLLDHNIYLGRVIPGLDW